MAAKRGLGKGLDTLIPAGEGKGKKSKGVIDTPDMQVSITKVEPVTGKGKGKYKFFSEV